MTIRDAIEHVLTTHPTQIGMFVTDDLLDALVDAVAAATPAKTFRNGTGTSAEAARLAEGFVTDQQRAVLRLLLHTPSTDHEIDAALKSPTGSTLRPRRVALVDAGFAVDSGKTRPSPSGRPSTVWTLTEKGRRGTTARVD